MRIPKRLFFLLVPTLICCTCGRGQNAARPSAAAAGLKCPVFPADNIWNTPVDKLPLDPHSAEYIRNIGADKPLHPDFAGDPRSGIPYNVVAGNVPKVKAQVDNGESDQDPVPFPPNPLIESGEDHHLLIVDQDACRLYELFNVRPVPGRGWKADSAAHFNLRSNALRPDGWTSADAAGTSIFAGLVRHDEVAAGEIRHAIRFTAPKTRRLNLWPARHYSSRSDDPMLPGMGLRVRLRADFDISGFSRDTQVILRALKKYGMILSDNGQPWFISGAGNPQWEINGMVAEMRKVLGANFEVVDTSPLMKSPNSAAVIQPAPASSAAAARVPMAGKCPVFPADNIWNTAVDTLPLDPRSATYIKNIGPDKPLHPDFAGDPKSGIPFNLVSGVQKKTTVTVPPDESDTSPVPIPANPVVEGGEDHHLLIVDQDTCKLFELFNVAPLPGGGWKADSAAHFDLRSNGLRPMEWTSADAAGTPIFPGLVRHDEVAAGEIRHAIRFTAPKTTRAYVWPARHFASRVDDPNLPPMGLRARLKADFDISGFSKDTQVILRALKKYGMILSDNGQPWFISGAGDPKWDANGMVAEMRKVAGSNFEVVDTTPLMQGPNSAAVIEPAPAAAAAASHVPTVGKCPVFPADNYWNTPVDGLPLDAHSAAYIGNIGPDKPLHPDFAGDPHSGVPYNVVAGSQHKVTPQVDNGESDKGPVPIPANPVVEGGEDHHFLVIDQDACRLYELFNAKPLPGGEWKADSSAYYDLRSNALRPEGWTSADAAGLPMFPGLVRYDEVAAGEIRHAIRFTAPKTTRSFIWPARHFSSRVDDANLPSMGLRLRLKADFDISGFSKETQVILRALKKYGMILADNGLPWFITGAGDPHWNADGMTAEMRRILGSNFEVVDTSSMMRGPNSGASVGKAQ
ncbi:MAG TPA: hypothetical protein VE959_11710 [Bryobacteraceae bacterium]|nr:hypothetical protein [Bryobacteraceae bacterium]